MLLNRCCPGFSERESSDLARYFLEEDVANVGSIASEVRVEGWISVHHRLLDQSETVAVAQSRTGVSLVDSSFLLVVEPGEELYFLPNDIMRVGGVELTGLATGKRRVIAPDDLVGIESGGDLRIEFLDESAPGSQYHPLLGHYRLEATDGPTNFELRQFVLERDDMLQWPNE